MGSNTGAITVSICYAVFAAEVCTSIKKMCAKLAPVINCELMLVVPNDLDCH